MQDGISKNTGTSWKMKAVADALTKYPTHEALVQAMATGQFTMDLILNAAGWNQLGTPLNKENLLKDATAAKFGRPPTATIDEVLNSIVSLPALVPAGSIFWLASETIPTGFLKCDGSEISRANYAVLFAVIGTVFGAGDGSTTFKIPDLRAAFIRGAGTSGNYFATFGEKQGSTSLYTKNGSSSYQSIDIGGRNADYISTSSGSMPTGSGGTTSTKTYVDVRPYNMPLTPIIKY